MKFAPWFVVLLLVSACAAQAFSLDPVHIHYSVYVIDGKDKPITTPMDVEFSVWQGGTGIVGSGKLLYKEQARVQPNGMGKLFHWMGSEGSKKMFGELRGAEYGLDKKLFVQASLKIDGKPKTYRSGLGAIDNAYTGGYAPGGVLNLLRYWKLDYKPNFKEFKPELARRGLAILYVDGRIQREDGSFMLTKGSKTSGVQELLDYCASHNTDGYIMGGSVPGAQQIVYRCSVPVRVHPAQGFSLDTGACCLLFEESVGEQAAFTIDSCMMVEINIRGLVLNLGKGPAVSFNPTNVLPLDSFVGPTMVDSAYHITSIANRGRSAIEFKGSINYCTFSVNEINGGEWGIHVDPGCSFSNNKFTCKHIHGQKEVGLLVEGGAYNVWEVNYNPDAMDPYPIKTSARNDIWFANLHARTRPSLTIEPPAMANQFNMMGMTNGYDNRARTPTNRIIMPTDLGPTSLKLGFAIETPAVPASGAAVVNRNPFTVIATIHDAGGVTKWTLTDAYGAQDTIDAPLAAGQMITLLPGESVTVFYTGKAPSWKWRAGQ